MKSRFEAVMMRIHFGEDDRWKGKPLLEAIIAKCQELGIANVMAYRGIEGYGASARVRRASIWSLSKDAPIMLSVIDTEEQIGKLVPHLDAMVDEGLVAMSRVEAIRYSREEDEAS
jgi:PII-like signaling protein